MPIRSKRPSRYWRDSSGVQHDRGFVISYPLFMGTLLKFMRQELGVGLQAMADSLHRSTALISKAERGLGLFNVELLEGYADILYEAAQEIPELQHLGFEASDLLSFVEHCRQETWDRYEAQGEEKVYFIWARPDLYDGECPMASVKKTLHNCGVVFKPVWAEFVAMDWGHE